MSDVKKIDSPKEDKLEFIMMMIELNNVCVNSIGNKGGMRGLLKHKYDKLRKEGQTHDEIIDDIYDTKFGIEKLNSLYSESLTAVLARIKESGSTSSSSANDHGLKKNSYIKSELYPMFNFTTERQMGDLEKLGLKKSPDTTNPKAIKPRVQYFRDDIIKFLNAHAKHAKVFDANRKVADKPKNIKTASKPKKPKQ